MFSAPRNKDELSQDTRAVYNGAVDTQVDGYRFGDRIWKISGHTTCSVGQDGKPTCYGLGTMIPFFTPREVPPDFVTDHPDWKNLRDDPEPPDPSDNDDE